MERKPEQSIAQVLYSEEKMQLFPSHLNTLLHWQGMAISTAPLQHPTLRAFVHSLEHPENKSNDGGMVAGPSIWISEAIFSHM